MSELITIVVPIYNVEKYLERCVKSLLNQTYKNLEIILVDDGSTDNSGRICDNYAKEDKRVKVIHKANGGLSDARNAGIDFAKGKYISFVDSDDWIPLNAINDLYSYMEKYNVDIVSGNMIEVFSNKQINNRKMEISFQIFDTEEAIENMLYLHGITNSACGKLYKFSLFKDIRFPVGKLYEDLGTTYKIYANSKKSIFIDHTVYYYFQNLNSIMHYTYSKRRLEGIPFAEEICDFLSRNFPCILNSGIFRLYYECLLVLNDMPFYSEDKAYVYKIMKKYNKIVLKDNKLYRKQKLLCISSLLGHISIKIAFCIKEKIKKIRGGI